jgi:hypothetical protein
MCCRRREHRHRTDAHAGAAGLEAVDQGGADAGGAGQAGLAPAEQDASGAQQPAP